MAAFTWTYTAIHNDRTERNRKLNVVALVSSSGTYIAGGIALNAGQLGLPVGSITAVDILDTNGDGYLYQWNRSSNKIQMFQSSGTSSAGALVELTSSVSPTSAITIQVIGY